MSMDSIPDDCLLHIFNYIHDAEVLFRCLRVCKRWNHLVSYRLARSETLLDERSIEYAKLDKKSICYIPRYGPLVEPILSQILRKAPKLKVVSVGLEYDEEPIEPADWMQRSIDRLSKHKPLEGLILSSLTPEMVDFIPKSVEVLASSDTFIQLGYYPRVKQLIVEDDIFIECIHRFPNIERLNLKVYRDNAEWFDAASKNRNILKNLKQLEIDTSYSLVEYSYASLFINYCPQLESAHFRVSAQQRMPADNFKHQNLINLVISYIDIEKLDDYIMNLIFLLKRCPNLQRLAIRNDSDELSSQNGFSSDEESPSQKKYREKGIPGEGLPFIIIDMLRKLVLLDMRNINGVDKTSAKHVQQYTAQIKRKVKFYFGSTTGNDEIKRDWPELFTDESQDSGKLNFMKDFFLMDYPRCNFRII